MKKLLLAALILVLAALAGWLILTARKPSPVSAMLTLPDGSQVRILAVTYGTNHVAGSKLAQTTARLPTALQNVLRHLLGKRATPLYEATTPIPEWIVWLEHLTNKPGAITPVPGYFGAVLGDGNNSISGDEPLFAGGATPVEQLLFSMIPRRERDVKLNIFYHDTNGQVRLCGMLAFANPEFRSYPTWQPETLPATKRAGDVEATLSAFETGYGNSTTIRYLARNRSEVVFGTNRTLPINSTAADLKLKSLTNTNEVWRVCGVDVSDATGNTVHASGDGDGSYSRFSFQPSLWQDEKAWKVKFSLKRAKGFPPDSFVTFKQVPLGELNRTNVIGLTTNLNGFTLTLQSILHRPPHTNQNSYSDSQLSDVKFTHSPLPANTEFDMVGTVYDNGKTNLSISAESTDSYHTLRFFEFPEGAKTADFIFAVQQARTVEFTVKPEPPKTMVDTNDWRQ